MEQGTFDLTQLATQPKLRLTPTPIVQETKTFSVAMGPKKDKISSQSKLPVIPLQIPAAVNQQPAPAKHVIKDVGLSKSFKQVPKASKIEIFRNVLDQVQEKIQVKKDKKLKLFTKEQEENNLATVRQTYAKQVADSVNRLYNNHQEQPHHIAFELKQMESKKNVQVELDKKVHKLNRDRQEHDTILYDIRQKQIKLTGMNAQINDLGNMFANEQDISVLENKRQEVELLQSSLDQAHHETSIMSNMFEQRRKLLIFIQKQCKKAYDDLRQMSCNLGVQSSTINYRNRNIESLSKMISKYRVKNAQPSNMWGSLWKSNFDEGMQIRLEEELSMFEDKQMFKEVINHEKRIEEQKQKVIEEQKQMDQLRARQDKDKENDKIVKDKNKIETLLNEKRKKKMFEKIRKVTRVQGLEEIIDFKNDQQDGKSELMILGDIIQREIEEQQGMIIKLSEKSKVLKYQTGSQDEDSQLKIDDLERNMMKEFDVLQDKEKQLKKIEKSIDEVSVAMSRVMYQLQGRGTKSKNIEITRDKLVATASVVSLRLERMLTVLSKKKEFLNEESINSNPRYMNVPDFIGINQKTYAAMEGRDYIDNDVFVYKEDDSLDEEELLFFEFERDNLKNPKDTTKDKEKGKSSKNKLK